MSKSALLGLHDKRDLAIALRDLFREKGYFVDITNTPEEMLNNVRTKEYDRYLMDLNLGLSNSPDITPAICVYKIIRERVESGEAKFLGISGNSDAVKNAREKGIPASQNCLDFDLEEFIE